MDSFCAMDLFDPSNSDEPVVDDLDALTSASSFLESKTNKAKMPPRSKTSADFRQLHSGVDKMEIGAVRVRTRIASSHSEGDFSSLPPEPQQGNIEYKLKLVNPTSQRLEHLVTQMKWRLREGQGNCKLGKISKYIINYFVIYILFQARPFMK